MSWLWFAIIIAFMLAAGRRKGAPPAAIQNPTAMPAPAPQPQRPARKQVPEVSHKTPRAPEAAPPRKVPVAEAAPRPGALDGLFGDARSLIRAVVAAEVLAPPVALRKAGDRLH